MCLAIRFIACVGELGVAFWECEHDYLEDSHDCGGVARGDSDEILLFNIRIAQRVFECGKQGRLALRRIPVTCQVSPQCALKLTSAL
jgi:hypothetical protein